MSSCNRSNINIPAKSAVSCKFLKKALFLGYYLRYSLIHMEFLGYYLHYSLIQILIYSTTIFCGWNYLDWCKFSRVTLNFKKIQHKKTAACLKKKLETFTIYLRWISSNFELQLYGDSESHALKLLWTSCKQISVVCLHCCGFGHLWTRYCQTSFAWIVGFPGGLSGHTNNQTTDAVC